MSDPKDLIEQLGRSNRRWKALALTACSTLALVLLFGSLLVARQQYRVEAQRRQALEALERATVQAANAGR
jgi:hypothetical protein